MDEATKKKVEATVLEILRGSDMDSVTEYKVRSAAADRLGIDLSVPERKLFVRGVVEGYLTSLSSQEVEEEQQQGDAGEEAKGGEKEDEEEEEQEQEEEEEEEEGGARKKEYDDQGDLILCRLSTKRRVTLSEFKGRTLVSIREFYLKDGKELPTSKGISMTVEQWEAFRNAVPAIEDAIKKLEDSD
ncbi:RNA polymerase II transcriptional coactivator KELP-like [Panicum virgatum]|uniref:DEK-C domain-containing protein n=1 Tax=Panicum virgatum TaxID=38727 RepID=A0A8T0S238_PANVG|nr:RNA polymerase II transcriptional coactivator KELP-like [Panicum virgatum]KAG2591108.1 hypothetical protein PVAP13_5NG443700 [Panicum virgatum]